MVDTDVGKDISNRVSKKHDDDDDSGGGALVVFIIVFSIIGSIFICILVYLFCVWMKKK